MTKRSIRPVIDAFIERKSCKVSNTHTIGGNLYLFGNLIAYWQDGSLWISSAGWRTVTTKDRLNGLPGVYIRQDKGRWYLNGQLWDGRWTKISSKFAKYVDQAEYVAGNKGQ